MSSRPTIRQIENCFPSPKKSLRICPYWRPRMRKALAQSIAVGLLALVAHTACTHHATVKQASTPRREPTEAEKASIHQPTAQQKAEGIYQSFSDADISFMTGMIPH